MSAIDDLPPLREVIRQHALSARKSLGQNFLLDLNLTARIARAAGPLEDATVIEIGPGPGGLTRALLALGARRVIAVERDERALGAARRDRTALSGTAGDHLRRRAGLRSTAVARRSTGEDRRQPALQHRDRAADRLAVDRAVAALVRHDGADVSARGGRAHRRARERRGLWTAGGAGELARGDENPVRHLARGLRAAAQGHLVGGAAGAAQGAGSRATAGRSSRWPRRRSASGEKCCGKASNRLAVDPARLAAAARVDRRPGAPKPSRSPALLPWPVN